MGMVWKWALTVALPICGHWWALHGHGVDVTRMYCRLVGTGGHYVGMAWKWALPTCGHCWALRGNGVEVGTVDMWALVGIVWR